MHMDGFAKRVYADVKDVMYATPRDAAFAQQVFADAQDVMASTPREGLFAHRGGDDTTPAGDPPSPATADSHGALAQQVTGALLSPLGVESGRRRANSDLGGDASDQKDVPVVDRFADGATSATVRQLAALRAMHARLGLSSVADDAAEEFPARQDAMPTDTRKQSPGSWSTAASPGEIVQLDQAGLAKRKLPPSAVFGVGTKGGGMSAILSELDAKRGLA